MTCFQRLQEIIALAKNAQELYAPLHDTWVALCAQRDAMADEKALDCAALAAIDEEIAKATKGYDYARVHLTGHGQKIIYYAAGLTAQDKPPDPSDQYLYPEKVTA